jgi:hypothetical protein
MFHSDLNGDGLEDLIALDSPNYGGFQVMLNQGNGTYSAQVVYHSPTERSIRHNRPGRFQPSRQH